MKTRLVFLMGWLVLTSFNLFAGEEQANTPYTGTAAFEKMKGFSGHWKGTAATGDKTEPAEVVYETSSYEGGKPAHTTVIDLHKI